MALRVIEHGSPDYQQMLSLRNSVLRIPIGLKITEADIAQDINDILIAAFEEDKMIGCCVLTMQNTFTCRLRQMAVLKSYQNKGIGAALLQFAETCAREKHIKYMVMHARKEAIPFYLRYGYEIHSEEYFELNILHCDMQKTL